MSEWHRLIFCGQKSAHVSCEQVKILKVLVCREQEAEYLQPTLKWKLFIPAVEVLRQALGCA